MDEALLFQALEAAMEREPRIHFVSTGGAISGHNEKTYEIFKARVEQSQFRNRFHLCGWVPTETVADYYREADLAVNVDRFSYEGLFGTRNRVLEWIGAGLPVVSTRLSELTHDLAERGLILTFEFGDWQGLAQRILDCAADPQAERRRATRARDYARLEYDVHRVAAPILKWMEHPKPAPDLPEPAARPNRPQPLCPDNSLARYWAETFGKIRAQNASSSTRQGLKASGRVSAFFKKIFG
jgi:glycosyltransferase involved in cell wall biosynthesis